MTDLKGGLVRIATTINRGKGGFTLGTEEGKASLAVGAPTAVKVNGTNGGFIVMLGLSREQVEELREMCNETLKEMGQ